jgi:hypothetical protein
MSEDSPQVAPLTSQQSSFWEMYQHNPDGNINVCISLRLSGNLNQEFLRKSLEATSIRHTNAFATSLFVLGELVRCMALNFPRRAPLLLNDFSSRKKCCR